MLTQDWVQPGDGLHTVLAADATPTDAHGHALVTAYAVRRPDGRIGADADQQGPLTGMDPRPAAAHAARATERSPTGTADVVSYSSAQYRWHARSDHGYARPDRPPAHTTVSRP